MDSLALAETSQKPATKNCHMYSHDHPELSGCITTFTVCNTGSYKLGTAMDTLMDQDVS